ncbi:MAG: hypothetical protein OEU68_08635 [Nitrospira sp.]|nr:hypothetical protein [Nitrospira sp.]MDH4244572.1 hypothetical protein [Nitrospira sp.]MDH4355869.1 hypothetical protein [Nitrospira sp.]MDH5319168.1 hypothetical protein [Nitrospira sp.]
MKTMKRIRINSILMLTVFLLSHISASCSSELKAAKNIDPDTVSDGRLTFQVLNVQKLPGTLNSQGNYDEKGSFMSVIITSGLTNTSGSNSYLFGENTSLKVHITDPKHLAGREVEPRGLIVGGDHPMIQCRGDARGMIKKGVEAVYTNKTTREPDPDSLAFHMLVPISGMEINMSVGSHCQFDTEFILPREAKSIDVMMDKLGRVGKSISADPRNPN